MMRARFLHVMLLKVNISGGLGATKKNRFDFFLTHRVYLGTYKMFIKSFETNDLQKLKVLHILTSRLPQIYFIQMSRNV